MYISTAVRSMTTLRFLSSVQLDWKIAVPAPFVKSAGSNSPYHDCAGSTDSEDWSFGMMVLS